MRPDEMGGADDQKARRFFLHAAFDRCDPVLVALNQESFVELR